MANAVVGLDSSIEMVGNDTGFKIMYPSIGVLVSSNFNVMVSVILKGEILYETGKKPNGAGQRASTTTPESSGLFSGHALAGSRIK